MMGATHAKIKRFIGALSSLDEVDFLLGAARERKRQVVLENRERAAAAREEAWDAVRRAKQGHYAVARAAAAPMRILVAPPKIRTAQWQSIELPRGSVFVVLVAQPRAKRIWLKNPDSGETYCLTPHELSVLDVRCYPDEMTARVAAVAATEGGT